MTRPDGAAPLPDLVLWGRDGCHLCDETADLLRSLLRERQRAGRATPCLVERRIDEDPAVERELFEKIPVLEAAGRRLDEATGLAGVRAFLAAAYDDPAA